MNNMRAPVCQACGIWTNDGEMITFKKSDADIMWDREMEIVVDVEYGQPPYTQWFCTKHCDAAKELGENKTFGEAVITLRDQFKTDITPEGQENLEKY